MSAKYTPGPWKLDTSKCADWGMILTDDGFPVAKAEEAIRKYKPGK